MKFKKLFSLSTLCVACALGVGLLGACDNEDNDTDEDICTGEECSTSESPAERNYVSQSLYTFTGTINLGLGTTVSNVGPLFNGTYYGDVDIPTTLTIGTYDDGHYTVWLDCDIPIESVNLSVITVKLTGYGGGVLDSVDTSHLSLYYDSEEDNVYYHRLDKGSGSSANTYEVFGLYETSEFLKNPLYYATKDMFGCGQRIFDGIDGIVSENPLDVDSLLTSIPELVTSSEITSGINVIGDEYTLSLDGGAPTDTTSVLGEVEASVSVYDDHSKDAISVSIPTYFTVNLGTDYNLEFYITMDLAIDTSAPKDVSDDTFSEIEEYLAENSDHFVSNSSSEESYYVAEPVSLTEHTYTNVTTYKGNITLSLTNIDITNEVNTTGATYLTEEEDTDEATYTYTGKAEIETTLDIGTYTDENGETQYTYALDCEIPIVTVQFASSATNTIKLTGYGNGGSALGTGTTVTSSHVTALYDTSDDLICWHRIDGGTIYNGYDTYEDWGAFSQEEFAKNPYYYITHDFFGCGARIYQEAVNAISEESIVGTGIVDLSQDEISGGLSSTFVWSSNNLMFGLDVSLTKDSTSSTTESELITGFVSYVNTNPDHFLTNLVIEEASITNTGDDGE